MAGRPKFDFRKEKAFIFFTESILALGSIQSPRQLELWVSFSGEIEAGV
jgi:hypothetical protein